LPFVSIVSVHAQLFLEINDDDEVLCLNSHGPHRFLAGYNLGSASGLRAAEEVLFVRPLDFVPLALESCSRIVLENKEIYSSHWDDCKVRGMHYTRAKRLAEITADRQQSQSDQEARSLELVLSELSLRKFEAHSRYTTVWQTTEGLKLGDFGDVKGKEKLIFAESFIDLSDPNLDSLLPVAFEFVSEERINTETRAAMLSSFKKLKGTQEEMNVLTAFHDLFSPYVSGLLFSGPGRNQNQNALLWVKHHGFANLCSPKCV